jgi:hypothetical protein
MRKRLALTFACALALAAIAPVHAVANLHAASVAAARAAVLPSTSVTLSATADVSVVSSNLTELTPFAMSRVHGAGPWNWVKRTLIKVVKWLWQNTTVIIVHNETTSTTSSGTYGESDVGGASRTDYISASEETNETYDENGALISSNYAYSESVDYTEYTPSGN